ncbi:nucleotidyl transferase AbiEii/AbiGii toxin family protein [bacterium]|nr:nucleotidyl transferase AbiEii/AbiGii toxin family protein [bacterium]
MQKDYYLNKLYPFQDEVFKIIAEEKTGFYLTGGTALGRFYLQHRFSDDLDFFLNHADDFSLQADRIIDVFKQKNIQFYVGIKSSDFVRISMQKKGVNLKVDFINDVEFHYGEFKKFKLFPRVDNWRNILSNKLTALDRREPKDIADILFICRNYSFHWKDIFKESLNKVVYLDALDVSKILAEFPIEYLLDIIWQNEPDTDDAAEDILQIAKDILRKERNSIQKN